MSMYGFLPSHSNNNDIVSVEIPDEVLLKKSGDSVKSDLAKQLRDCNISNILVTKQGLSVKHGVATPLKHLEEVLHQMCRSIVALRDGVTPTNSDVRQMTVDIVSRQIRENYLQPKKLNAFGVEPNSSETEQSKVSRLVMQLAAIVKTAERESGVILHDGGLAYWKTCCARLALRDLELLVPLSRS